MAELVQPAVSKTRPVALAFGEGLARDARTRLVAAVGVVLVHSTHAPGTDALAAMAPGVQGAAAALYAVAVTFPVHAFVLLSFLSLRPRLDAGVPTHQLLRASLVRLGPAHLFWVAVFLAVRALYTRTVPQVGEVASGFLWGTAADHLYFTPLLLILTATAAVWGWLARTLLRAVTGFVVLAVLTTTVLLHWVGDGGLWSELAGPLTLAPIAITGLFLGRLWRGTAPVDGGWIFAIAGGVALLSAFTLANDAAYAAPGPVPFAWSVWLCRIALSVSVPVLLLAAPWKVPMSWVRIAPYTLGVYFVHPLFIKTLQLAEARLLPGFTAALIVPNAVLAFALSLGAVVLLAKTPLRRVVL